MFKKITIIGGAGHVGLAFALICASNDIKVHIHDINSNSLELIKKGKLPHKENNAEKILQLNYVDGFLIGSASTKPDVFNKICLKFKGE